MSPLHQSGMRCSLNLCNPGYHNRSTESEFYREGPQCYLLFLICFLGAHVQENLESTELDFPKKLLLGIFVNLDLFLWASVLL